MNKDLKDFAIEHIEPAKETLMVMGHDQFDPMVHFRKEGYPDLIGKLAGVQPGQIYMAVQAAIKGWSEMENGYIPDLIAIISDAYYIKPDGEYLDSVKQGTNHPLSVMFALGDPRVKEAINILFLSPEGNVSICQPYRWTPVDGWEWDDYTVLDSRGADVESDWTYDRLVGGLPRLPLSTHLEDA